ncbi:MoaD/ThiS family protein [Spirochaetota bacterium]
MQVKIHLVAFLKKYAPGDDNDFMQEIPHGAIVSDVIETLGIPVTIPRIAIVNGIPTAEDKPVNDGDEIILMMPVEGG